MTDNAKLVRDLIDAAYDSGYFSSEGKDGQSRHLAVLKKREQLRDETLQRLAERDALRTALEKAEALLRRLRVCNRDFAQEIDEAIKQARAALGAEEEAAT